MSSLIERPARPQPRICAPRDRKREELELAPRLDPRRGVLIRWEKAAAGRTCCRRLSRRAISGQRNAALSAYRAHCGQRPGPPAQLLLFF